MARAQVESSSGVHSISVEYSCGSSKIVLYGIRRGIAGVTLPLAAISKAAVDFGTMARQVRVTLPGFGTSSQTSIRREGGPQVIRKIRTMRVWPRE